MGYSLIDWLILRLNLFNYWADRLAVKCPVFIPKNQKKQKPLSAFNKECSQADTVSLEFNLIYYYLKIFFLFVVDVITICCHKRPLVTLMSLLILCVAPQPSTCIFNMLSEKLGKKLMYRLSDSFFMFYFIYFFVLVARLPVGFLQLAVSGSVSSESAWVPNFNTLVAAIRNAPILMKNIRN